MCSHTSGSRKLSAMQARHVGPAQAWAQEWTSHRAGLGADHAGQHAGQGAGQHVVQGAGQHAGHRAGHRAGMGKPGRRRPPCRPPRRHGQARAPQATVQATAQAWASQGAAGHPQGVALLYTAARHGSARPISAFVYSRATPIGVNLSRHRPPARGGPTIYERVVGLVEPPRIVGPPLAGGL
jgi:hypothetical protein